MKIKVAILDSDINYLNRISAVLLNKFYDKLDVFLFTDPAAAVSEIKNTGINVLVSSEEFDKNLTNLPANCALAFFTDLTDVAKVNGFPAISRYQKAENFYRQVLNIYSDMPSIYSFSRSENMSNLVIFSSPCGGVGTSSMAAAFAIRCANSGKKALYLNMEKFGGAEIFFNSSGISNMSELIYAIKGRKSNLRLKIESALRADERGVYFIASADNALDIVELEKEEILYFVSELRTMNLVDYVVLDMDFGIDKGTLKIFSAADRLVWISEGTDSSNQKITRAAEAITIIEKQSGCALLEKVSLIYNKFSNKIGSTLNMNWLTNIGGLPKYEHAQTQSVLSNLSSKELLDKLM